MNFESSRCQLTGRKTVSYRYIERIVYTYNAPPIVLCTSHSLPYAHLFVMLALTALHQADSGSEPQSEADLPSRAVYTPLLTSIAAHPISLSIALRPFRPHLPRTGILLHHVDEPCDRVRFAADELLCVEVFTHCGGEV